MKINLFRTGVMLAIAILIGGTSVRAEDLELTSNYDSAEESYVDDSVSAQYAADKTVAPAADAGACSSCGSCDKCGCNDWCAPVADHCPRIGKYFFSGIDSFKGIGDGTFQSNYGAVNGLNIALPVPRLDDYGIGYQLGASYGVYDWNGRSSSAPANEAQQQIFVTTGFFRRADADRPVSGGIVYDWNMNDNYGAFAHSPTLGQWRMQLAYALSARNEVGMWGTVRDRGDSKVDPAVFSGTANYRAISQGNLFWHHKYARNGADSWFYVGIPDRRRLNQDQANFNPGGAGKSLGELIVGTNWLVPITNSMSLYANGMYMKPSAHAGQNIGSLGTADASTQDFWNVSFGVAFYPGGAARSSTVAGRTWMPYMPVANNSNFLIDTNAVQ